MINTLTYDEAPVKKFLRRLENEGVKIEIFKRFGSMRRYGRNKTIDLYFENYDLLDYAEDFLERYVKSLNITFEVNTSEFIRAERAEIKEEFQKQIEQLKELEKLEEELFDKIVDITGYRCRSNISIPPEWYNYIEEREPLDKPYITLDCENNKKLYYYIKDEKYLLEDGNTLRDMWTSKEEK